MSQHHDEPFSHVDADGKLMMVDVADKTPSRRAAHASGLVVTDIALSALATSPQGLAPVVTARLAGIQAAKNTAQLIPLCHPLALHDVSVEVREHPRGVEIVSRVVAVERTGVEMEALTACSFAALNLLHSLLVLDRRARIEDVHVVSKSGGTSGDWGRPGGD